MDIGNMQRVIIVEQDRIEVPAPDEPEPMEASRLRREPAEEWPLPIEIEPAYEPF